MNSSSCTNTKEKKNYSVYATNCNYVLMGEYVCKIYIDYVILALNK